MRPLKRPHKETRDRLRLMTSSGSAPAAVEEKLKILTAYEFRDATNEERLLAYLFQDYEPIARAVVDNEKAVVVDVSFVLLRIHGLEERNQVLTTTGLIIAEWTDERLTWKPEKFGGVQDIILKSEMIWLPELAVMNGAEELMPDFDRIRILLNHTGKLHWEPGGIFRTTCDIDIAFFPFDVQTCPILIGAYSYYSNRMNITSTLDYVATYDFQENGEWQVENTSASWAITILDCCPGNGYAHVHFTLTLRRRCRFYLMNIVLPCIMLSTLIMIGFFLPPEAGEKISLGISVLLAFTVFLLMIADSIPRTSLAIPLIVVYLMTTMTLGTISICMTVLVLNVHHRDPKSTKLHPLIKSIFLVHVANLIGVETGANRNLKNELAKCKKEQEASDNCNVLNNLNKSSKQLNSLRANVCDKKSLTKENLLENVQLQSTNLKRRKSIRPFTNPSFCMDKLQPATQERSKYLKQRIKTSNIIDPLKYRISFQRVDKGRPVLDNKQELIWKRRISLPENSRTSESTEKLKEKIFEGEVFSVNLCMSNYNGRMKSNNNCTKQSVHNFSQEGSHPRTATSPLPAIQQQSIFIEPHQPVFNCMQLNNTSTKATEIERNQTNISEQKQFDRDKCYIRQIAKQHFLNKFHFYNKLKNQKTTQQNDQQKLNEAKFLEESNSVENSKPAANSMTKDELRDFVKVLDRMFFWFICILMTLTSTLILLYPAYMGS